MRAGLVMENIYNARIALHALVEEGCATTYASVVDLTTNDPTHDPGQ